VCICGINEGTTQTVGPNMVEDAEKKIVFERGGHSEHLL